MSNNDLIMAMQILEEEKGISREVIKEALEQALVLAYKKDYDQAPNVEVKFDTDTGVIQVFSVKEVVETNLDNTLEISLEEARKINRAYEIGDQIPFEVTPKDFGRIAAQTAKHVVLQRLREAERDIVYDEFIDYEDEIMTGTVERQDQRFLYVNLGKAEAVMPTREQIPTEMFEMGDRIKVYVEAVDKTTKGPQIIVSRAHPDFLKRLFEQEVPEIYDGIVEIMSIAREAGDRSKVAVRSRDNQIDPVGTCVGQGGQRVNMIVNELNGENMDIVEYSDDIYEYITNAMKPAQVLQVVIDEEDENSAIVVVPDYQLSLAIGKKGQNARLAARLTSHRIDIKSESDYADYLLEREAIETDEDEAEEIDVEVLDVAEAEEVMDDERLDIPEELRHQADIDEQNYSPDDIEEAISEVEIDRELDYEGLVEEEAFIEEVEETDVDNLEEVEAETTEEDEE